MTTRSSIPGKPVSAEHRCAELGYIFGPEHNGKGYATEAAHELLRFGFEELGMHRIVAHADAEHTASQEVMRRIGMRNEAHFVDNEWLKGRWSSEVVWAILRREWRDR